MLRRRRHVDVVHETIAGPVGQVDRGGHVGGDATRDRPGEGRLADRFTTGLGPAELDVDGDVKGGEQDDADRQREHEFEQGECRTRTRHYDLPPEDLPAAGVELDFAGAGAGVVALLGVDAPPLIDDPVADLAPVVDFAGAAPAAAGVLDDD